MSDAPASLELAMPSAAVEEDVALLIEALAAAFHAGRPAPVTNGRPRVAAGSVVYGILTKIHRAQAAREVRWTAQNKASSNTILRYLQLEETSVLLRSLVGLTAEPLLRTGFGEEDRETWCPVVFPERGAQSAFACDVAIWPRTRSVVHVKRHDKIRARTKTVHPAHEIHVPETVLALFANLSELFSAGDDLCLGPVASAASVANAIVRRCEAAQASRTPATRANEVYATVVVHNLAELARAAHTLGPARRHAMLEVLRRMGESAAAMPPAPPSPVQMLSRQSTLEVVANAGPHGIHADAVARALDRPAFLVLGVLRQLELEHRIERRGLLYRLRPPPSGPSEPVPAAPTQAPPPPRYRVLSDGSIETEDRQTALEIADLRSSQAREIARMKAVIVRWWRGMNGDALDDDLESMLELAEACAAEAAIASTSSP